MVTRIHPLDVKLTFEDRHYHLGDTVDLSVEITPRANVEIREGRVELLYEEHYSETRTVMMPDYKSSGSSGGARNSTPEIPRHIVESRTESVVHGSVVFLKDTRVHSGDVRKYDAQLQIHPEAPPYEINATVNWSLVVVLDVAHAVDIHEKLPIHVIFG